MRLLGDSYGFFALPTVGLTSNIFVVEEDGTLYTAPSGVLLGGMRQLCIEICTKEGFPVKMEPPDMSRAGRWHAAFLTGAELRPMCVID